jgi:membrane associated rhomboid family serine protease
MRPNLPPVTLALLLANVGIFLLQQLIGPWMLRWFALWAPEPLFEPWQLLTSAFLHGGFVHIFFNMFALFMFGPPLERLWGSPRFAAFYFACALVAALTQLTVDTLDSSSVPSLGASGAIFGLLLAFAIYFPRERIMLVFLPIPLPAWLFVPLYALAELFQGVTGYEPGVAHFAHLGGLLGGAAMLLFWRYKDGARTR